MKRFMKLASAGAMSIALMTAAHAEDLKVSELDVKADFAAADSNALGFYPELASDLKAQMIEDMSGMLGESPFRVEVNIHEVSLDGDTFLPDDGEFNKLSGTVNVFKQGELPPIEKFNVELDAYSGDAAMAPAGAFVLPPDREDFYNALVEAFALEAKTKLEGVDTTGETIPNDS